MTTTLDHLDQLAEGGSWANEANVVRGAAWLDDVLPDWYERIDFDRLLMMSCHRCILGQVFGPNKYDQVFDTEGPDWIVQHGFVGATERVKPWWETQVELRRAA